MGFEFLHRVRKTSIITALLLFPVMTLYLGVSTGVSWLAGCAWSLANLFFIRLLITTTCSDAERKRLRLAVILLVKVPVLYVIGFLMLRSGSLSPIALLVGFMWPLFVITMKAAGRLILGLDSPRQSYLGAGQAPARKRS